MDIYSAAEIDHLIEAALTQWRLALTDLWDIDRIALSHRVEDLRSAEVCPNWVFSGHHDFNLVGMRSPIGLRQRDSHLAVLLPLRDNRLNRGVVVRRVFPPIELSLPGLAAVHDAQRKARTRAGGKLQVTRIVLPPLRKAA